MPAVEEALQAGRLEEARDIAPGCYTVREPTELDSWLIGLWNEMKSDLIGSKERFVRMRIQEAGLSKRTEPEVWRRLLLIDRAVALWSRING